jgi:RNA polymerase sigma-70 factor (ECF subfamily)
MVKLSTQPAMPGPRVTDEADAALVAAARRGDEGACFRIWSRYAPFVSRLMRVHSGRRAEQDDMAQEVFLRVFSRIDELRDPNALRGFVAGICLGVARNMNRRARIRSIVALAIDEEGPEAPVPAADDETRQVLGRLLGLLAAVGDEDRTLFLCRYVEKMEMNDVAVAHGLTIGTAKRRVARMTSRISAAMERDALLAQYAAKLGRKRE